MDSSQNNRNNFSRRFRWSSWAALSSVLLGVVLVFVTGCTEQKTEINPAAADMASHPDIHPTAVKGDFGFPSAPPSLMRGREVFQQTCAHCHAAGYWQTAKVKTDLAYTTPIDFFEFLSTGEAPEVMMPTRERRQVLPASHGKDKDGSMLAYADTLSRDDRWAVLFYARYRAGAGDIQKPNPQAPDVANIFGGNCAVCHGNSGKADGPLYTGKTGNHELHDAPQLRNLMPAPANLAQYDRIYNRTDAQLFRYICQGIYPSAMPSWYGNVAHDKDTGAVQYVFDDSLIWNMVRHVRTLSVKSDLPDDEAPPPGLQSLQPCPPEANNQPWTNQMRQEAPVKNYGAALPSSNPVTGGLTLPSGKPAAKHESGSAE